MSRKLLLSLIIPILGAFTFMMYFLWRAGFSLADYRQDLFTNNFFFTDEDPPQLMKASYTPPDGGYTGGGGYGDCGCTIESPQTIAEVNFNPRGSGFDPAAWDIIAYECTPDTFVVDYGVGNAGDACGGPAGFQLTKNGSYVSGAGLDFFLSEASGYPQSGAAILCPGGPGGPYAKGPGRYGCQNNHFPNEDATFCVEITGPNGDTNEGNNTGCLDVMF